MDPAPPSSPKQQLLVWWVLWAAFQIGIFFLYFFLSRPASAAAPSVESLPWVIGAVPVFLSAILRWIVLPRFRDAVSALPIFLIGIALAEATCFLGLFLFPAHQRDLFILSVLGIAQFVPFFAQRYFENPEDAPDRLRG